MILVSGLTVPLDKILDTSLSLFTLVHKSMPRLLTKPTTDWYPVPATNLKALAIWIMNSDEFWHKSVTGWSVLTIWVDLGRFQVLSGLLDSH